MEREYKYSCKLEIGDMLCSLNFAHERFAEPLREYYRHFLTEDRPDFQVDIEVVLQDDGYDVPEPLLADKVVQGSTFNFCDGLIEGHVQLGDRYIKAKVREQVIIGFAIGSLEQFLVQIYYTWQWLEKSHGRQLSFIVHACGIEIDGHALLFTGPSGSGKTTVGKLAKDNSVLNDELVLVKKCSSGFQLKSTPFRQSVIGRKDSCKPLTGVYFLEHARVNRLEKMQKCKAAADFLQQLIICEPLLSTDKEKFFTEMADFATDLASHVEIYRLHFLPEGSVWDLIDKAIAVEAG